MFMASSTRWTGGRSVRWPTKLSIPALAQGTIGIMKIAQIAPLYESCPPRFYGGTERVVSYLTEELVRQGHDVTLFASGDSRTRARVQPACARALRLEPACNDPLAHHMVMLHRVRQRMRDF